MSQLLIREGNCVSSESIFIADILIDDGQIVAIKPKIKSSPENIIDAHGCYVIPGGVDVHVHLPWPSGNYISQDTINSGTKAAAFGGVTTVIDFAIPEEEQSLQSSLEKKLQEAKDSAWVDYSFHLNIRGEISNKLKEVKALVANGFPSFKVFMAYEGFRIDDPDLIRVLEVVKNANGIVNVHAENGSLADFLTEKLVKEGKSTVQYYGMARPEICETEAIYRILSYERAIGTRLHIHHVSSAKGAEQIKQARRDGLPVSGETCPHYLLLNESGYSSDTTAASYMVCAPSIKSAVDQAALWEYLADGTLSVLATDHCPYSKMQKEEHLDDFSKIPGGIPGVELRLPLVFYEGVIKKRISLQKFVDVWATGPAKIFGLYPQKGTLSVGADADLVILNPGKKKTIHVKELHMQTDCLPYENREFIDLSVTTILRGKVITQQGTLLSKNPSGMLIPRYFIPNSVNVNPLSR